MASLKAIFTQGTDPERLARCLALGALIGVFPVLGTTTALCALAAASLRLNLAAIQAVNWLMAGVQLMLIIPFVRAGERLLGVTPLPLAPAELAALAADGPWNLVAHFPLSVLCALVGWLALALPVCAAGYAGLRLLLPALKRSYLFGESG